jgi:NADH dehydrogenase
VAMASVVIVGSGFTGFECARHLARKLLKHNTSADITIISPVDYMLYTPLLPDVAGGVVDARFVAIPLANTLRGVQAIRGVPSPSPTPKSAHAVCRGIAWSSRLVR